MRRCKVEVISSSIINHSKILINSQYFNFDHITTFNFLDFRFLGCDPDTREANWQYLKHVVLKFIIAGSSDRESLAKVLCTVLHLTAKEQKVLYDTLAYKKKGPLFGTKPKVDI